MSAHLELWTSQGPRLVPLEADRLSLGKADANEVPISDRGASRLHAVLERFASGWSIRDLTSRNGTFVNGERIHAARALRSGDEIRIGKTRLVFRESTPAAGLTRTEGVEPTPDVTRREHDVLVQLCRPLLTGDVFTEPASIREIAQTLVVTEAAVKQHLIRLYAKFGIAEDGERRRVRLANEAMRRGAVTVAELRHAGDRREE